jgi:serine/threonine protein kinase/tetratricopeptide (TPR) repeat protein
MVGWVSRLARENMIGKTLSHFRIVDKLGEGGMGVVYRAEDRKLGRQVALKVLHGEFVANEERRRRFIREARISAAVSHPNIAAVHEIDEEDGVIFIAMELVQGRTLKAAIDGRPLRSDECLDLAIEMAEGLAHAHESSIVHRDLKPENVIVSPGGHAKILDFGLAKLYEDPQGPIQGDGSVQPTLSAAVTREGRIVGTVAYMSPEQARGVSVDARSDVFTFGVVLYEMVTGKSPFQGETITDTLTAILRDRQPPVAYFNPQAPAELERIMARCLEKRPEDRYQNAGEILADLRSLKKVSDSQPVPLVSDTISGQWSRRPLWRRPLFWTAALVVAASVIVGGAWVANLVSGPRSGDAARNALAVLPFENLQDNEDPQRLGQILQELIIADLSELGPLRVFSSQRLLDIHKQLGGEGKNWTIDRELATEVALRAGAGTLLTGTLSQLGARWILTCQMVDLRDGTVIKSQRLDGADLYTIVDRLTPLVREDLGLIGPDDSLLDVAVKDRTSDSIEAYQEFLAGVELLNGLQFEEAAARLQRAVEIDPSFGRAYYKLAIARWWDQSLKRMEHDYGGTAPGEVLRKLLDSDVKLSRKDRKLVEAFEELVNGRPARAEPLFDEVVRRFPDEKEAWYGLAEARFHGAADRAGRLASLEPFEKAIELDPSFSLAYYHLVDLYVQAGRIDEAIAKVRGFIEQDPGNPSWYREWIRAVNAKGDPAEIDAAIEESLAQIADPGARREFLLGTAKDRLEVGAPDDAQRLLEQALALGNGSGDEALVVTLGEVALARHEYREAEALFLQVHEADPRDSHALRGLFTVYSEQRRYAEAIRRARELAGSDPGFEPYLAHWLTAAIKGGDDQEVAAAWSAVEEMLDQSPDARATAAKIHRAAVRARSEIADFAGMERLSREFLGRVPEGEKPEVRIWLGWAALNQGRAGEAADCFEEALEQRPDLVNAVFGSFWADLLQGNHEEALAHAERLDELAGHTAWGKARLVEAYLRTGDEARAETLAREAPAAPRTSGERRTFHGELALGYMGAGRFAEAEAQLRKAISLKSETLALDLQSRLGWVLTLQGKYDDAWAALERGAEQSPDNARIAILQAANDLARGDAEGAERRARDLLSRGPAGALAHRVLAYALAEQGRFGEAEPHARKQFAMNPNREGHVVLAWVLITGGLDLNEGLELAEDALELDQTPYAAGSRLPYIPSPEECLGLAYFQRGRPDRAVEMLEEALRRRPDRSSSRELLDRAREAVGAY